VTGQRRSTSFAALGHSVALLTGGTLVAQVLGIGRELFIANQVGLSSTLDALLIALVLPMTLGGVLSSGTITALVPAYVEAEKQAGPHAAREVAGAVLGWVSLAGVLLTIALYALSGPAMAFAGPGLDESSRSAGADFLRVVAPMAALAPAAAILGAVCQAEGMFGTLALSAMTAPGVTLALTLLLWAPLQLGAVAIGNVVGIAASLVLLLAMLGRGPGIPRVNLRIRGLGLRPFFAHALPLTISSGVLQLNPLADRAIASIIAPGAVSALRYAEALARVPISAIGPAWSQALYPTLVRAAAGEDSMALGPATERTLRFTAALFVPLAMLTAAVAPLAVQVAYGRGAFGPEDVAVTTLVVAGFAPLIFVLMLSPVLVAAHNALRHGMILLVTGTLDVALNIAFDFLFGLSLGVAGIALATSLSATLIIGYLAWRLARTTSGFSPKAVLLTGVRAGLAAAPGTAVIGWLCWQGVIGPDTPTLLGLAWLAFLGLVGVVGYALVARTFGPEEAPRMVSVIAAWRPWRRG
jgi:putative peptidoglycan lipid II flippase